jgi:hypothetical protein
MNIVCLIWYPNKFLGPAALFVLFMHSPVVYKNVYMFFFFPNMTCQMGRQAADPRPRDYIIILQTETMLGTPTLPWPMLGGYAGPPKCNDQSQQPSSGTERAQASSYVTMVGVLPILESSSRVQPGSPPQHSLTVSWTCQWAVSLPALVRESSAYTFAEGKMEGKGEDWWMWIMSR